MTGRTWTVCVAVVVAAVGLVLWNYAKSPEPAPVKAPTVSEKAVISAPSPADLAAPAPEIRIASSSELAPPVAIREPAIRGIVMDGAGMAVDDAAVTVYNNEHGIHRTFSDRAGAFAVGDLQKVSYRVSAQKARYNEAVAEEVVPGPKEVALVLTDTSTAAGRVVDEQVAPVPEFEVVYLREPPDGDALWKEIVRSGRTAWMAFNNPEGAFEISDIASGVPFALGARAEGYEPGLVAVPAAEPGMPAPPSEIVLKTEGRVSGLVTSPDGEPVAGATIHLGPDQESPLVAESDRDGRFVLTGLGDMAIELTAADDRYLAGTEQVQPVRGAEVPVEIVLGQGGAIEGMVWKGDAAAAGQTVVALRLSPPRIRKQAVTDDAGRYQIAGLGLGLVDVIAKWKGPVAESMPQRLQRQAEIEAGATTVVDFHFASGVAALEGEIVSSGEPVSFAEITGTVVTAEGQSSFSANAGEDGTFRIDNLVPGTAWVTVVARSGDAELRRSFTVELAEGTTAYQEVVFETEAGVEGTISNIAPGEVGQVLALAGHDPVDTSTFEAIMDLDSIKSGECDVADGGHFMINGMEPGPYTLVALVFSEEADTGDDALNTVRVAIQQVTVTPDSSVSITLNLNE